MFQLFIIADRCQQFIKEYRRSADFSHHHTGGAVGKFSCLTHTATGGKCQCADCRHGVTGAGNVKDFPCAGGAFMMLVRKKLHT